MISASQIREVVSRYLANEDAEAFICEFSSLSHNIHKNGDAEAVDLANQIEARMADRHSNKISASEFSEFLRGIVNPFVRNSPVPVVIVSSSPVNSPAVLGTAFQALAGFSGTLRGKGYGSKRHLVPGSR
jgi:hypothetical protein